MERKPVYINGMGMISPQLTFDADTFLAEPRNYTGNVMRCVTPDFKTYISAVQLRRLSRFLRIGLSAAVLCMRDAKNETPDGIITSTGYGFLNDTALFLRELLAQGEKQLTPTHFMQGTYNALAGLIALSVKCTGYNATHVSKGFAFETALLDASMQLQSSDTLQYLVGAHDEADELQFDVNSKAGHYKRDPVRSLSLFESNTVGSLQGEGAAFFMISAHANEKAWCRLRDLRMIYMPEEDELSNLLREFLTANGQTSRTIDVVISGASGDPTSDRIINSMMDREFRTVAQLRFKHLCGEYCTASSFAVWMGANVLKRQAIPEVAKANGIPVKLPIHTVLIINHYYRRNYTFLLLENAS